MLYHGTAENQDDLQSQNKEIEFDTQGTLAMLGILVKDFKVSHYKASIFCGTPDS